MISQQCWCDGTMGADGLIELVFSVVFSFAVPCVQCYMVVALHRWLKAILASSYTHRPIVLRSTCDHT